MNTTERDLSIPQKRQIARMHSRGLYEATRLPAATARALAKRGLVTIKDGSDWGSGVQCLLTDAGRNIARRIS